jgi:hypothetical protein
MPAQRIRPSAAAASGSNEAPLQGPPAIGPRTPRTLLQELAEDPRAKLNNVPLLLPFLLAPHSPEVPGLGQLQRCVEHATDWTVRAALECRQCIACIAVYLDSGEMILT